MASSEREHAFMDTDAIQNLPIPLVLSITACFLKNFENLTNKVIKKLVYKMTFKQAHRQKRFS
jgi:hypothetical protein